jgi:hypothetical protein
VLAAHGIGCKLATKCGQMVAPARNSLVEEALAGGFSHLLMVDSDMSFEPADALLRLLAAGKDVVGTVSCARNPGHGFEIAAPRPVPGSRLMTTDMMGCGMVMLSRRWLTRMNAAWPNRIFESRYQDGVFISEDFTAWTRWRRMGGELFIDPSIRMFHYVPTVHDTMLHEADESFPVLKGGFLFPEETPPGMAPEQTQPVEAVA